MLTVFYALLLLTAMFAPLLLIGYYDRRQNHKAQRRLAAFFDASAAAHSLRFASKECLLRTMLGVDAQKRKMLLAFRGDDGHHYCRIIHVDSLAWCSYHQELLQPQAASLVPLGSSARVSRVYLRLESGQWPAFEIDFYERAKQRPGQLAPLQLKAKQWEALIMQLKSAEPADTALPSPA